MGKPSKKAKFATAYEVPRTWPEKVVRRLLMPFFGRRELQGFYEGLHRLALEALHYGPAGTPATSGERWLLEALKRHYGDREVCVFDVGASRGDYTQEVLDTFGRLARITAVEPASAPFQQLVERFQEHANVTTLNLGLGTETGHHTLYADRDGSLLGSLYPRRLDHFGLSFEHQEQVDVSTLDSVAAELGADRIHLLKLDVEGNELAILHGARKLLGEQRIDAVQFEFGGCHIDARTFLQDFYYELTPGYDLFRLVKNGVRRVSEYEERLEVFHTQNLVALRRDEFDGGL